MTRKYFLSIIVTLFCVQLSYGAPARSLRPTNYHGSIEQKMPQRDADTLLTYYDERSILELFQTLPGDLYEDTDYNVRFTPKEAPFQIKFAHILLFGDTREFGMGHPGMRVKIWESDEDGYPSELLKSVDVPFEELVFGDADSVEANIVDLRDYGINFGAIVDFHVGIEAIVDTTGGEYDTLGVYSDNGEDGNQDGRSIIWIPEEGEWATMNDVYDKSYNWSIRVVVGDPLGIGDTDYSIKPQAIFLDPAWPNPFNSGTNISYSVPIGSPYTLDLIDLHGRIAHNVSSGYGNGSESIAVDGAELTNGVYFLRLNASNHTVVQKLFYMK